MVRMKALGRAHLWWPGLDQDIEQLARSCPACAQLKSDPRDAPLLSWGWPDKPWQRVHVDHAGPFMGRFFLVVVDAHSGYPFVDVVANMSCETTADALYRIFAEHGAPQQLVSDNGGAFVGEFLRAFSRLLECSMCAARRSTRPPTAERSVLCARLRRR